MLGIRNFIICYWLYLTKIPLVKHGSHFWRNFLFADFILNSLSVFKLDKYVRNGLASSLNKAFCKYLHTITHHLYCLLVCILIQCSYISLVFTADCCPVGKPDTGVEAGMAVLMVLFYIDGFVLQLIVMWSLKLIQVRREGRLFHRPIQKINASHTVLTRYNAS